MILLVIVISMLNTGTVNSKQDQFEEMKKQKYQLGMDRSQAVVGGDVFEIYPPVL